jgi:hypothetical protein
MFYGIRRAKFSKILSNLLPGTVMLRAAHHIEELLIYRDFLRDWRLSNLESLSPCVMFSSL